jgi:hypothetical protein
MIGRASERSGPKLGTGNRWRMNNPAAALVLAALGFGKKCGGCFQSANIGSLMRVCLKGIVSSL